VLAGSSRPALFAKIISSLGAACLVDQPEERRNVIFEAFLTALMEQKASSFQGIIIGGESLFVLYYPVIRSGWRRGMSFLKSSNRKVTRKNA
jgi:hypothetical protein